MSVIQKLVVGLVCFLAIPAVLGIFDGWFMLIIGHAVFLSWDGAEPAGATLLATPAIIMAIDLVIKRWDYD